jgi:Fic family protein
VYIASSSKNPSKSNHESKRSKRTNVETEAFEANPAIQSGNVNDNAAIRQSDIFQKIKDLPGESIQLKDLMGFFPGVSERTLRYDLQRLSAEGKIERIGQGGPATYYKARVV